MKYLDSTILLTTLNNYDYSLENIQKVKSWLNKGVYPEEVKTKGQKKKYADKWGDYESKQNQMFFKKDNLEVISLEEKSKPK
jgi:hypothetical protein